MDWRIIVRREGLIYRAFKVIQNANNDITIIPHRAIHIDRSFLDNSNVGDKLKVSTQENEVIIDHYSAHSKSGQRHIKFSARDRATQPIIGEVFQDIKTAIPLVSIIASTAREPDGEPKKGKWYGFEIPSDTDHCIFDLWAIPKDGGFNFKFEQNIKNEKQSVETFNSIIIPQRTVSIVVIIRTSNHNICTIPYNVLVQQSEDVTAQVVRVSEKELELEISNVSIGQDQ